MEKIKEWSFGETSSRRKIEVNRGSVFGELEVLSEAGIRNGVRYVICVCTCGIRKRFSLSAIASGSTKSCGHVRNRGRAPIHGHRGVKPSRTYSTWLSMKGRCFHKGNSSYYSYGAKGITICDEWIESFDRFLEDMGERPDGMTLDRIDNSKGYSKDNCRWATPYQQQCNRPDNRIVEFNGVRQALAQHCREQGMRYTAVLSRLKMGWDIHRALTQPIQIKFRKPKP